MTQKTNSAEGEVPTTNLLKSNHSSSITSFVFLRPTEFHLQDNLVSFSTFIEQGFRNEKFGIDFFLPIRSVVLPDSSNTDENGVSSATEDSFKFNEAQLHVPDYIAMKNYCAEMAEALCDSMREYFFNHYKYIIPKKDALARSIDLDFGQMPGDLYGIMTRDPYLVCEKYFSEEGSQVAFRKLFQEFVEDRNRYVHGKIAYLPNGGTIGLLTYDRSIKKRRYFYLTTEVFKSYVAAYMHLKAALRALEAKRQAFLDNKNGVHRTEKTSTPWIIKAKVFPK